MTLLLDWLSRPNLFNKFRKKVSDFFSWKQLICIFFRVFLLRTFCRHVFRSIHWSVLTMDFCNNTRLFFDSVMLFCMSKKFSFTFLLCNRLLSFCDSTQLFLAVKHFVVTINDSFLTFFTWKEQKNVFY